MEEQSIPFKWVDWKNRIGVNIYLSIERKNKEKMVNRNDV